MNAYNYDPITKEYIGTEEAQPSPEESGVFLLPAHSTDIAPPKTNENEVACWSGVKWVIKDDYRGGVYWDAETKEKKVLTDIGMKPSPGWVDIEPTYPDAEWVDDKWEVSFSTERNRKFDEVGRAFKEHISGSFMCSLGYPMQFNEGDILKMEGAIQLMEITGNEFGYLTDANNKSHYNIPILDIRRVKGEMLMKFGEAHLRKQELREEIEKAKTKTALNKIKWEW